MPVAKLDDTDIFYTLSQAEGKRQPLTLVLIHGLGSSHCFFAPVLPILVSAGFDCLSFDLPASALASKPSKGNGIEVLAEYTEQLLEFLHISSNESIAVGHSMGALVVGQLACRKSLAGIILIGPIFPSSTLASIFEERIKLVNREGMEPLANVIPGAATGSQATPLHRAFIRSLLLSQEPRGYITMCQTIVKAISPDYSSIRCPVLAIAGEDDKTANRNGTEKILDCYSSATEKHLESIPGVGHWHCIESPEAVGGLIKTFSQSQVGVSTMV